MSTSMTAGHGELVGREVEVADVCRLLSPGRVLTLIGVGGAGKTRIARSVIADASADFAAGVWVVELADFVDPDQLGEVVARTLGLLVPAGPWDGSVLNTFFADRPGLLVLDNCEHLLTATARLVGSVLAACPGLTVLATSRLPLGIMAESIYQVPPLSVPGPGSVGIEDWNQFASMVLYSRRAKDAMASFRLTAENVGAVGRLVSRLDGVPLAIELAAARVRLFSPDLLLKRIGERHDDLESNQRDVPERHRSLSASVAWSYDLCTPAEKELWMRLSIFGGGFELDAAVQICSGNGIEPTEMVGLLSRLVDMSVVVRLGETGSRYRMLEPIRQYGAERLIEKGEPDRWRDNHLRWYAALTARLDAEWCGPEQLTWLDRIRVEYPNLIAAIEHALSDSRTTRTALRMCLDLEALWICGGHLSEARRLLERALGSTDGQVEDRVRALRLCAWLGALQLDLAYARERVVDAAGMLDGADDETLGHYLFAAGVVSTWEGSFDSGIQLLGDGAAAFERAEHTSGLLNARLNIAIAHVLSANFESAATAGRVCLEMTESLGETVVGGYVRWVLGLGLLLDGDLVGSLELLTGALERSASVSDRTATALEVEALAWHAATRLDPERAVPLLGGASLIWQMVGMPVEQAPGVGEFRAHCERQMRAITGDSEFEGAFARGLAMTPGEVVDFALRASTEGASKPSPGPLSRRESEVAALVAEGLSNRDIAERLFVSERTAQGHVQSILRKLAFGSRAQIAVWFVSQGRTIQID